MARRKKERRPYRIPAAAIAAASAVPAAAGLAYANREKLKRARKRAERSFLPFVEGAYGYSPFQAEIARARRRRLRRIGTAAERVDDQKRVKRAAKYAAITGVAAAAARPIGRGIGRSLLGTGGGSVGGLVVPGAVLGVSSAMYYGRRAAAEADKATGGSKAAG